MPISSRLGGLPVSLFDRRFFCGGGLYIGSGFGIGGDLINDSEFRDHLERFEQAPETGLINMIGEIVDPQVAEAAACVCDGHQRRRIR